MIMKLTKAEIVVYEIVKNWNVNEKGKCGYFIIAQESALSESTVTKALRKLVLLGYIQKSRMGAYHI